MKKTTLSEAMLKTNLEELGNKICIVAGVGSGKNYWVEHDLTKMGNVLLVTSRRAIADETEANNNGFKSYYTSCINKNEAVVYTHAKLATLIRNYDTPQWFFNEYPMDYLVIDEAHSLITDSTFSDSTFHVWAFLQQAVKHCNVILMSATIEPIRKKMNNSEWKILDLTNECISVKPNVVSIISRKQAIQKLSYINEHDKAIYMCTKAGTMVNSLRKELNNIGLDSNKIACILSDERRKELFQNLPEEIEKAVKCYDNIVNLNTLPIEIEILLTTSKLREGVNLKDTNIKMIFIESHNAIDIFQFIGRVRVGVEDIYIIDDASQNDSRNEYYNLDYQYSKKEIKTANSYLKKSIEHITNEYGTQYTDNYYGIDYIKIFISYIESKFQFIRFNHFINQFEIFNQRYEGAKLHDTYLARYNQDRKSYIKELLNIDNVIIDVKSDRQIIYDYITNKNLLLKYVNKQDCLNVLNELTALGIRNQRNQPYRQLGSLLKSANLKLIPVFNKNNGVKQIVEI